MNNLSVLISNFGGLTQMSKIIGVPISTIQSWQKAGHIPHWRIDAIVKIAKKKGIEIPADQNNKVSEEQ